MMLHRFEWRKSVLARKIGGQHSVRDLSPLFE